MKEELITSLLAEIRLSDERIASQADQINSANTEVDSLNKIKEKSAESCADSLKALKELSCEQEELEQTIAQRDMELAELADRYEALDELKKEVFRRAEADRDTEKRSMVSKEATLNIKTWEELFGVQIQLTLIKGDDFHIKFAFNSSQFVELSYDCVEKTFSLLQMEPEHPNFTSIKDFLKSTGDVAGLLHQAGRYFDRVVRMSS